MDSSSLSFTDPEKGVEETTDSSPPAKSTEIDEGNWPKGWRPWTTLAACFFLMFNSWGLVNAYGTFASYYKDVLLPNQDALFFNFFGATECFMVLALSGVVGRLLDAGFYRYLTGTGFVITTLSFFMLSISNGEGKKGDGNVGLIWLTHGFLDGLGMSCFFVSSSQIAATWFVKRKSLAIGIVASGASISGLVYPIMLRFLITKIGFNNAVRGVAGLIGLTALFSFLFAVPNPEARARPPKTWKKLNVWIDPEAFKNKQFCWFTAAIAFMFLGFYAVFFNLEEWAAAKGVGYKEGIATEADEDTDRQMTAGLATYYLLAIMNAMSTFGRIGAAWASDHVGGVQVHTVVASVCSLLVLILWTLTTTFAGAMGFITFFGIFSGALIGLPPASMAYILGKAPARQAKLGQWTGMMYTAAAIPSLIGPIIAGHLVSEFEDYITVQMWSGTCLALAAICMGVTWWHKSTELAAGGPPTTIAEPAIPLERVPSQASWQTRGYDTDRQQPEGEDKKEEEIYGKS
ncbi:major facilitator superfamily domain-containing protein [Phyllosticta capitalensis]|uniref:major facilitator superfamily domain-containing protein n=1 Tax=Phyllosticta capitalensis TaxID=121624 RepID=UPI003131A7A9